MTSRRQFVVAGAFGALGMRYALAQSRPVRIGVLLARPFKESFFAPRVVQRLAEVGYRPGTSMLVEHRSADGDIERFPKLARELAEAKCDLFFAIGPYHAARALQAVSRNTPIVILAVDYDPLEQGIVTSLTKPDRNTTGAYMPQGQLAAKRLEVLREIIPQAQRFLVLSDVFCRDQLPALQAAAQAAKVQLTVIELSRPPYDLGAAFASGQRAQVEGFIGLTSPAFANQAPDIAAVLARHRLPSVGWTTNIEGMGFLIGYAADTVKAARTTADIAVRILKGAKPAAIPVEQVDEFELVINGVVARDLGLRIPESVLARATRIVT
jgi:putative tryptophan/tyrosine transport system substrate-binding protein